MADEFAQNSGGTSLTGKILAVVGAVCGVASLVMVFVVFSRVDDMQKRLTAAQDALQKTVAENGSQSRASVEALRQQVGMTKQQLARRTASLQEEEKTTQTRLTNDEEQTKQQFGAVTSDVNGVKTQVGKVAADVSSTQTDLADTKTKLDHAIGDINKHSELIATNHDELEVLKHRGDRDYFEFTLIKDKAPTRLSTISLQLKKTDPKKSQFTIYVMADDKKIEKKDRTINEPLQFYASKDRGLYEVVVNTVDKNQITGYLSTPKGAAPAATTSAQASPGE